MKRILMSVVVLFCYLYSCAMTENDGIAYIQNYYRLLSEYAAAENVSLARKIESMHVGNGYVYPDVEINLGRGMTETEGVGIKSVYLASVMSRQNLLLKFVPKNILSEGNNNGICTMVYKLYVYSSNEQPGRDVLKYSVSLRMEIQNSDRKIRSILKNTHQNTLSVSPSNLSFGSSGGTRTITVSSNRDWSISVNTASWGHLTRNDNTLTLTVDNYMGTTERTDYFKIKAGDKEERVNIRQNALYNDTLKPFAKINSITVSQNQDIDGRNGIVIHMAFKVQNMKGKDCRVGAYFYDSDGNALVDLNNSYCTTGEGKVSTGKRIKPKYDETRYDDLQLRIPYSELHQSGTYSRTIKFLVVVWDYSISPPKKIVRSSSYTTFTYTPDVETYLKVDNNTTNKVKNFPESGGRETYYVNTSESSYETCVVPSWCRIENKTSSSFTLVCEPNTTSDERRDYMKIKAGGKEIRIDIKQEGKSSEAKVKNCRLEHNLTKSVWDGDMWLSVPHLRIHCHFNVAGHKGENIRVCAFFYYSNGNSANAVDSEFRSPDGQAMVQGVGRCTYDDSVWKDYTLDIPNYALPNGSLSVQIEIHDKDGKSLAKSSHISFSK
ncbi:MAG: BACON domain-containing protein [Paludibacteraceae bacterium]|nr:BACON domain-containing protein [Paludibacteraceae bacterium]